MAGSPISGALASPRLKVETAAGYGFDKGLEKSGPSCSAVFVADTGSPLTTHARDRERRDPADDDRHHDRADAADETPQPGPRPAHAQSACERRPEGRISPTSTPRFDLAGTFSRDPLDDIAIEQAHTGFGAERDR